MTNGERKALAFLAGMAVLGGVARVALAPDRAPTRDERLALAGQIDAVDSARRASHEPRDGAGGGGPHRRRGARAAGDSAAPPARARVARVPPVVPAVTRSVAPPIVAAPSLPVDVDVADLAGLEALPGVGPGLAQRIAEDRAERGPFGSLSGLQRVRGVGPKLAARVAPYVTFSGIPRPSSAAVARPP